MDWLLTRQTVVGLAILGAAFSALAMLLRRRRVRTNILRQLDLTGYILMGISMLLFIVAGLRGAPG